ncbi:MAG: putative monovalent cation/H+ antiporter subunit A [Bacteroidota bacterium]
MLYAVLALFGAAFAAPFLYRRLGDRAGAVLALVPAALFVYFAGRAGTVTGGETVRQSWAWVPSFDVSLAFTLDGLSLLFALLITGLGALILLYASGYLAGDDHQGRLYGFLLGFAGAMLGLVLSDNLIALFVFWELTSFTSYLLIGYKHGYEDSRASALQALLVTGAGGLALLAGLLLLGAMGGTFSLTELAPQAEALTAHPLYAAAFVLLALGAITKSAQVPFHFWLPNAMAAPTPVSAFLHSATMVKAGVYLLARLDPILGGTTLWVWTLAPIGAATMLTGAVLALRRTDLKKILAYSTITALGTLVLLLGLSFEESVKAAVVFLLVHALYKAALFMLAGSVDHETGTRDVTKLGGLRDKMPWTSAAAILAGLSMAGLPPLFGFIGKELAYKAKLGFDAADIVLPGIALLANALTATAAAIVVIRTFFGAPTETPKPAHEAPWSMRIGPLVPALTGLMLGIVPALSAPLVDAAAGAILGKPVDVKLTLWYGLGPALYLSIATVALGIGTYLAWDRVRGFLANADGLMARGPEAGYRAALAGMVAFAGWSSRTLQHGRLTGYIATVLLTAVGLVIAALVRHAAAPVLPAWDAPLEAVALAVLVAAAAIAVPLAKTRLAAVAILGASGFGLALLFLLAGAPDLAMTQLLVETLIVLVIVLVMRSLPAFSASAPESAARKARDAGIAVAVGATFTALALVVIAVPLDRTLADALAAASVPEGFGRNVVNVILVDFRALDTLGEITVLAIAALGAAALVRRQRASSETPSDVPDPARLGTEAEGAEAPGETSEPHVSERHVSEPAAS